MPRVCSQTLGIAVGHWPWLMKVELFPTLATKDFARMGHGNWLEGEACADGHHTGLGLAQAKGYQLLGFAEITAAEIASDGVKVRVVGDVLGLAANFQLGAFCKLE